MRRRREIEMNRQREFLEELSQATGEVGCDID